MTCSVSENHLTGSVVDVDVFKDLYTVLDKDLVDCKQVFTASVENVVDFRQALILGTCVDFFKPLSGIMGND